MSRSADTTLVAGVWCVLSAGSDPSESTNWTHFPPELSLKIERSLFIEKRDRFEYDEAGDTIAIVRDPGARPPVYYMHWRSEESPGVALSTLESRRTVRRDCEFQGEITKLFSDGYGFLSRSKHHVAVSDPKRADVYFSFHNCYGVDTKLLSVGDKVSYRIGTSKAGKVVAKSVKPIAGHREAAAGRKKPHAALGSAHSSAASSPFRAKIAPSKGKSDASARVFETKRVPKYGDIRYIGQICEVKRNGAGAVTHGFVKRRYLKAKKQRWQKLFFHVTSLEKPSKVSDLSKDVYLSFQIRCNPVKGSLVASNLRIGHLPDLYSRKTTLIGVVERRPVAAPRDARGRVQPHRGWLFHKPENMIYPFYVSPESVALHSLAKDAVVRFRTEKKDDGVVATQVKATRKMSEDEMKDGGWLRAPNRCCELDKLSEEGCVVFNSEFAVFESSTVELKSFLPYSLRTGCVDVEQIIDACDKYLSAFANSPMGGSLYFGVKDNGMIVGQMALDRHKIDLIRTEIDALIKTWKPLIGGVGVDATRHFLVHNLSVVFVPVYQCDSSSGFYYLLPDTYLVKCSVTPMCWYGKRVSFLNREGQSRAKLQGSVDTYKDISGISAFSESKMDDESITDASSSLSGSHPLSDEPLAIDPSTIDSLMRFEGGELTRSQVTEVLRLCNGDVDEARSVLGPLREAGTRGGSEAETRGGSEDETDEGRQPECDSDKLMSDRF